MNDKEFEEMVKKAVDTVDNLTDFGQLGTTLFKLLDKFQIKRKQVPGAKESFNSIWEATFGRT